MDRDDFLNNQWRPYPTADQFPVNSFSGRIETLDEANLVMRGVMEMRTLVKKETCDRFHAQLGETIPWTCLRLGDWVLWDEAATALYLLSPCLVESKPEFDDRAARWSTFLRSTEAFFEKRNFTHLRTPFLVESPGVDHHIHFMEVRASHTERRWTLPTSPEIHLKKFLCQGYQQIFEIKNCFRDDLVGEWHRPEFTMLEWYRAFATLDDLVSDLEDLLQTLSGSPIKLVRKTLAQVFVEETGFVLTPATSKAEMSQWAQALQVEFRDDDDWNDLFFRIFMEKVEPGLGSEAPLVVECFPAQQASLAQISEEGWAQRFELYWKGVELANAYLEVNDPNENRRRFAKESELRRGANATVAPVDQSFYALLDSGMPPASGIALGLDRLYAVFNGQSHLPH